jgi:hypothetical protein
MDTQKRQQKRPATAATETKTEAQRQRAEAQEEQLEAQERGDTKSELKEFAKEVIDDHRQFFGDVAEDSRHPERREGEQQETPMRPRHEAGRRRWQGS